MMDVNLAGAGAVLEAFAGVELAGPYTRAARPAVWDWTHVEARLRAAGRVVRRLPPDRELHWLRGDGTAMPQPVRSFWDSYGVAPERPPRPAVPSGAEIDDMLEALCWTLWLEDRERAICIARACGVPWKALERRTGVTRQWARALQIAGLKKVSRKLNDLAKS